mmetsp:Transcript_25977/g.78258  ORF Transcript_25977/g.78258 Transcript_25977/m.78258 type:complete len:214 (+) Transcript_25977:1330-1971(+)
MSCDWKSTAYSNSCCLCRSVSSLAIWNWRFLMADCAPLISPSVFASSARNLYNSWLSLYRFSLAVFISFSTIFKVWSMSWRDFSTLWLCFSFSCRWNWASSRPLWCALKALCMSSYFFWRRSRFLDAMACSFRVLFFSVSQARIWFFMTSTSSLNAFRAPFVSWWSRRMRTSWRSVCEIVWSSLLFSLSISSWKRLRSFILSSLPRLRSRFLP